MTTITEQDFNLTTFVLVQNPIKVKADQEHLAFYTEKMECLEAGASITMTIRCDSLGDFLALKEMFRRNSK